jgi:hypothetical protein
MVASSTDGGSVTAWQHDQGDASDDDLIPTPQAERPAQMPQQSPLTPFPGELDVEKLMKSNQVRQPPL